MKIFEFYPEQFNDLKHIWEDLETGSDMTIFQSFLWYKWLNKAYSEERTKKLFRKWIYFVCIDDNNVPLMIAPIQIIKYGVYFKRIGIKKGVYFIGRKGYTDYLNFIYKDFDGEVAKELLVYIKGKYKIEHCIFEGVLEETEFASFLQENYSISDLQKGSCAALMLPESFEVYKSSLKKHAKQNIRTALNRQKRDCLNITHKTVFEIDNLLQKVLWSIRAQRLKQKNKRDITKMSSRLYNYTRNNFVCMFNAKQNVFTTELPQWCFLVKDNDKVVGFYWGVRDVLRKCYYVILAGVDLDFAWYSPSISHLYQWIGELYENENKDIRIIDFTVGDERYKTDIGGTTRNILKLEVII